MRKKTIKIAIFNGPWETGHKAKDGAILSIAEMAIVIEKAINYWNEKQKKPQLELIKFDIGILKDISQNSDLDEVDIFYGNCGPLVTQLFLLREKYHYDFSIIRELHTLGWISSIFQEYIAKYYMRENDLCIHSSLYSKNIWVKNRGYKKDNFLHPLLHHWAKPANKIKEIKSEITLSYINKISRDKGFQSLPQIIERLKHLKLTAHHILIAGEILDQELFDDVTKKIKKLGINFTYYGPTTYQKALKILSSSDLLVFPSLSSSETTGRVLIEAYQMGIPAIATYFGAGSLILSKNQIIPTLPFKDKTISSTWPSQITEIDYDFNDDFLRGVPSYNTSNAESFRPSYDKIIQTILGHDTDSDNQMNFDLEMKIPWENYTASDAKIILETISSKIKENTRSKEDLIDFGGILKRSLIEESFTPNVTISYGNDLK